MTYLDDMRTHLRGESIDGEAIAVYSPTDTPVKLPCVVIRDGGMAVDLDHPRGTDIVQVICCLELAGQMEIDSDSRLQTYRRAVYEAMWRQGCGTVTSVSAAHFYTPYGYTPDQLAYFASTITFTEAIS